MIQEITSYSKSRILIGESFENFIQYIPVNKRKSVIIITDENINRIYGHWFPDFPVIEIGTGEQIKTQETINYIVESMLNLGVDRHSYLVGIGGGVVCDITGYVASVFMRGIEFGYVSTSLLSQVDASTGGKTGINFGGFKNMLGTFNHPDFVICDPVMLSTLSKEEIQNGLAEVVKHALIADIQMLEFIEDHVEEVLNLERKAISYIVSNSVRIKTSIVITDENEKGERKKLNLGHTFGHAIEKLNGISHGKAVAIGIVKATKFSAQLGFCTEKLVVRIGALLNTLGLPTKTDLPDEKLIEAIEKDKKRKLDELDFVFIQDVGRVFIKPVLFDELIIKA